MDNIIIEIINKHNLFKKDKDKDNFINYMNEQEYNQDNINIINKIKETYFSKEKYEEYEKYITKIENFNKDNYNTFLNSQTNLVEDLKLNIINFIKNIIYIYNYKNELIKRIGIPNLARVYMKPIVWNNLSTFKNLEKIFGKSKINKTSNSNENKNNNKIDDLIFERIYKIFIGTDSLDDLKNINLKYKGCQNFEPTEKNGNGDKIYEINEFTFYKNNNIDLKISSTNKEKEIYLFLIIILEITYNILKTKGDFTFFTHIYNSNELYKIINTYFNQNLKNKQKNQHKNQHKDQHKDQYKAKYKNKTKFSDKLINNVANILKKGGDKPDFKSKFKQQDKQQDKQQYKQQDKQQDKQQYKQQDKRQDKQQNKQPNKPPTLILNNIKEYYYLKKNIKTLSNAIDKININSFTLSDFSNTSFSSTIYNKIKEYQELLSNSPNASIISKKEKLKQYFEHLFCNKHTTQTGGKKGYKEQKGQKGQKDKQKDKQKGKQKNEQKKLNKTLNIFNIIFSKDDKILPEYMINGNFKDIEQLLLPYNVDNNGENVINFLDTILTNDRTQKIIENVFNLYISILYNKLKYILEIYNNIKQTKLIQEIIKANPRLDLFSNIQNQNSPNSPNAPHPQTPTNQPNQPNQPNQSNNKNNQINPNIIKLDDIKSQLDALKLKYLHDNTINNSIRKKIIDELNKRINNIIIKLNSYKQN